MMSPSTLAAAALAVFVAAGCAAAEVPPAGRVEDFDATWRDGRWQFSNGPEFPGAKGSFGRMQDESRAGDWCGRLEFDFRGGGNYVAAALPLEAAPEIAAVRVRVRKPRRHRLTFRYTDPTGQTLQRPFQAPDDRWADVLIPMNGWSGHWGGANDGRLHGPPRMIAFLIENTGRLQGELLIDDVRLVEGKPEEGAGMVTSEIVAYRFDPAEGWHARGGAALDGRTLKFDFTRGAGAAGLAPPDLSLLGLPKEVRIRVRGKAEGHPVRVQMATHFMTFEKAVGEFKDAADGTSELAFQAPPGEGWRWFGGENDGKIHGPLRLTGLWLEAAGRKDSAALELVDIRTKVQCLADRACVLIAEHRDGKDGGEFALTLRSLALKDLPGTVSWTLRDWSGRTVKEGSSRMVIPPGGAPIGLSVGLPPGRHEFLEAEFSLDAPDQATPAALACYVAPIEPQGSAKLEPTSPFGMGVYLYRYPGDQAGLKEMDRAATMAQAAGVKWSREEFGWARIEPAKGTFDWTFYDAVVATARRHGISVYGLLSYWSGWTKPYTPEGIEDYCRFAAAAALRYKDDIRHWEVWNEPNIFFWQGPPDMYAELLTKAYAAIKKANPEALVLGCSTAGIDSEFIRRTMQLGAPFDILTIHPYRASLNDRQFTDDLRKAADLAKRPDAAPREVWITEMGWATHMPHNAVGQDFQVTSQREQACLLARAYIDAVASGAAPNISWYDFRNDGTDPFNFEHNMGILTRDFRTKPAYRALATLTRMLRGARSAKALDLGPETVAYEFPAAGGRPAVTVLWSTDDEHAATIPAPGGKAAVLTDLMGGRRTIEPADGKLSIPLRPEAPVFLTAGP